MECGEWPACTAMEARKANARERKYDTLHWHIATIAAALLYTRLHQMHAYPHELYDGFAAAKNKAFFFLIF